MNFLSHVKNGWHRLHWRRNWATIVIFGLLAVLLAVTGYWLMFTQFMGYDDEGYILWTLRAYCSAGGLYDRVPSIYGPFYYLIHSLFPVLTGQNFNHDIGRLLTLAYWLGSALLCGVFCWRQTKNRLAGCTAAILAFVCLVTSIREPMHPGGLLGLLVILGVIIGAEAFTLERPVVFAMSGALLGTAMVLTKINVGFFFLTAAVIWMAVNTRAVIQMRAVAYLGMLGCAAVPFTLMRPQWPDPWVTTYVLVFVCGSIPLMAALHQQRRPEFGWRAWMMFAASALTLTAIVLADMWLHGSKIAGLWRGVVATPMQHPMVFYMPWTWLAGTQGFALALPLVAVIYYLRRQAAWMPGTIAALRIAAGAWFLANIPSFLSQATSLQEFCFDYGPSLAWLMAVPLAASNDTDARARLWLAWVFIWQTLQAYPVAGSQIGWGAFLWAPLFVCGWYETVKFWADRFQSSTIGIRRLGDWAIMGAAMMALWHLISMGHERFAQNKPLNLPGAKYLRLDNDLASDLCILNQNIQAHGGTLFTFPGMLSFNIWSGHEPLTAAQDEAVIEQLATDPHAVVIVNDTHIHRLMSQQASSKGAIARYLSENFVTAFQLDSYEFMVHRGRAIAPFSLAQLLPAATVGQQKLKLVVAALPRPVASIELTLLDSPHAILQQLPLDAAQHWTMTPLTEAGKPADITRAGSGPATVSQPARLSIAFTPDMALQSSYASNQMAIRLLDQDQSLLGTLRLVK